MWCLLKQEELVAPCKMLWEDSSVEVHSQNQEHSSAPHDYLPFLGSIPKSFKFQINQGALNVLGMWKMSAIPWCTDWKWVWIDNFATHLPKFGHESKTWNKVLPPAKSSSKKNPQGSLKWMKLGFWISFFFYVAGKIRRQNNYKIRQEKKLKKNSPGLARSTCERRFWRVFWENCFLLPETQRTKRSKEFLGSWLI